MTEVSSDVVPAKGRWHRVGPERPSRLAINFWVLGLAIYALAYVAVRLTGEKEYLQVGFVVAGALIVFGPKIKDLVTRPRMDDLRLMENPDDPDVCLVDVDIVVDHESVGRDRGVVWFEGGRLLFTGHRTSFALGGEDVVPDERWRRLIWDQRHMPQDLIPLEYPGRIVYVAFTLARRGEGVLMRQEMNFVGRLDEFRRRPPSSTGPRQLPPLER
jgi:hypothetical protein